MKHVADSGVSCNAADRCTVQSSTHARNVINQDRVEFHHRGRFISAADRRQSTQSSIEQNSVVARTWQRQFPRPSALQWRWALSWAPSVAFDADTRKQWIVVAKQQQPLTFASAKSASSSSTTANASVCELFSKTVGSTSVIKQATPGSGKSSLRNSGPVNQILTSVGLLALPSGQWRIYA